MAEERKYTEEEVLQIARRYGELTSIYGCLRGMSMSNSCLDGYEAAEQQRFLERMVWVHALPRFNETGARNMGLDPERGPFT